MKTIYLAGPIGRQTIESANVWRKQVQEYFFKNHCCVNICNPLRGKVEEKRKSYNDSEIISRDKSDIRQSDFILVYWPDRIISNGSAMEIEYAWQHEIPIIFVGKWAKEDVWIRYHVSHFCDDLTQALDYIREMWL